ncbi:thiamine pyrophosphate-binding protein [Paraburkholderia sp. SG-MS1]|uniref:thiamine pyrophosphate-binding protein n=1 Tax=Paraburkholderia sp. SG-MS1 TaxID=2023741 RepID=UPI001447DFDB|nr:thiamine pyrophosphate-binding protein [Paraburkholderia sp. SG-MS1]
MLEPVSRSDTPPPTDMPKIALAQSTVAQVVAEICVRHGVRQIYGLPGGGSSLDVMQAFAALGVRFVLAHTEAAAGMMAAADAEAHGGLAVVVTTQGPGTASVANAIAHASLDRVPVLVITDGWTRQQLTHDSHQVFDQRAMLAPVVKAHTRLDGEQVAVELERLIAIAGTEPCGPVYLELTGENARRTIAEQHNDASPAVAADAPSASQSEAVATAIALIEKARRPVIVAGLEARSSDVASRIDALAMHWQCPVLTTYKAKGVTADESDHALGLFTGGALERSSVESADLIVLCGLDPVELIGRPWPYTAPVIDLSPVEHVPHYVEPAARLRLPLARSLDALSSVAPSRGWSNEEFVRLKTGMHEALAYAGSETGLTPVAVVQIAARAAQHLDARVTVDAGAHMFSAMAFWPAKRPRDVLISNGLASMAFALPAGIAMGVSDRTRQVIAFTGDGGLLMCIGELATAVREGVKLCIVVFNDSTLSLIQIKQQSRGLERDGIEWPRIDFPAIARGFGMSAFSVVTTQAYENALEEAFATNGPCLIDVHVDPSGYLAQSKALRG